MDFLCTAAERELRISELFLAFLFSDFRPRTEPRRPKRRVLLADGQDFCLSSRFSPSLPPSLYTVQYYPLTK